MENQVLERKISPQSVRMERGKALERDVRQAYEEAGWTVIAQAGMPDLLCIRTHNSERELLFVECKAGSSNLRPHQREALGKLESMGLETTVVREVPELDQHIDEVRCYLPATGSSFRLWP